MKINTTIGIEIIPISKMDDELKYSIINKTIDFIKSHSNVNCNVGPLETTIEGDYSDCMNILYEVIKLASNDKYTIFTNVKIIHNPNKILTIKEKINQHN